LVCADDVAVEIKRLALPDGHPEFDVWIKTDRGKHGAQLRLHHDAGPTAGQLDINAFENVDLPAAAAQRQRGEQAADRTPDDNASARSPRLHRDTPPLGAPRHCQRRRGR